MWGEGGGGNVPGGVRYWGESGEKGGYIVAGLMQTGSWLSRKSWMSPPSHYRCVDQRASWGGGGWGGFIEGGGRCDRGVKLERRLGTPWLD